MVNENLDSLPDEPANLAGESVDKGARYNIKVSNAAGYLCHIHMESTFKCPPEVLFRIFTNPDNTGVFRDIKKRGGRKVLELDPAGRKIVEVEQVGEARVLFKTRRFSTFLHVDEDGRDPENLITSFTLIRSDILSRFNGSWALHPLRSEDGSAVVGTAAVLEQDILPAGAPAFLKHVPVLGAALRGICVRAVKRMVEDLDAVLLRVENGTPLDDILSPPQPVASHVVDFSDDEDEGEGEEPDQAAAQPRAPDADVPDMAAKAAAAAGVGAKHHVRGYAEGHALPSSNGAAASGEHAGPGEFWDRQSWPDKAPHEGAGPAS